MAEILKYVDTDVAPGGDGSSGDPYNNLSVFEAAEQTNLITDGNTMIVYCVGATADFTAVTFDGWTLGASNTLTFQGDNTTGFWDTDYYRLEVSGNCFRTARGYLIFNDIYFKVNSTANDQYCFEPFYISGTPPLVFNRCLFRGDGGSTYYVKGYFTTRAYDLELNSCIFSGFLKGPYSAGIEAAGAMELYNCVVSGNHFGIKLSSTITVTNSTVFNNTDDFSGGTPTITYSAGDDAEFASGTGNIQWTSGSTDWDDNFTDYSTDDFTLIEGSDLIDTGTATSRPATDITGYTWDTDDIGAFAYVAGGGATVTGILPAMGGIVTLKKSYHRSLEGSI